MKAAAELKKSIETLLSDNADDRYTVITPQNRKSDAQSVFEKPRVTVFYSEGGFDKSKSSVNSPYHHDATFNIWIQTAAKAAVNLAILQNPAAAPEQYAAALANADNASVLVDEKTDAMLSALFDIIMSPVNRNLGADYVTNRWITQVKKHNPEPTGAIVMQVASITLTAQCEEEVSGETGATGNGGVDTVVDLGDESKQGVKT